MTGARRPVAAGRTMASALQRCWSLRRKGSGTSADLPDVRCGNAVPGSVAEGGSSMEGGLSVGMATIHEHVDNAASTLDLILLIWRRMVRKDNCMRLALSR